MRESIDQIQTEWDVCARELQAAHDRVHTQNRIRQVSVELADIDQVLEKQDQWLATTSPVKSDNEVELRNLSGEFKVRFTTIFSFTLFSFILLFILSIASYPGIHICLTRLVLLNKHLFFKLRDHFDLL